MPKLFQSLYVISILENWELSKSNKRNYIPFKNSTTEALEGLCQVVDQVTISIVSMECQNSS